MRAAMNTGVSREEIPEIVLETSVHAGVPACMNTIAAARRAKGRSIAAALCARITRNETRDPAP
ncbi:hypothetical protein [Sagittula stellata]|uniref:hypothetical protein n=1 Tax=Sagittula stellata TaxID=52603 RepID=UPI0039F1BA9C